MKTWGILEIVAKGRGFWKELGTRRSSSKGLEDGHGVQVGEGLWRPWHDGHRQVRGQEQMGVDAGTVGCFRRWKLDGALKRHASSF